MSSAVKKAVRQRDGNRCVLCHMTKAQHVERFGRNLEVHRLVPGSVYAVGGCITVCKPCHSEMPGRRKGQPDLAYPARAHYRTVRIPEVWAVTLDEIAAERGVSLNDVVAESVADRLERLGRMPELEHALPTP